MNNIKLTLMADGTSISIEGDQIVITGNKVIVGEDKVIIEKEELKNISFGNTNITIESEQRLTQKVPDLKPKDEEILVPARMEQDEYDCFIKHAGESIEKKLKSVRAGQLKIIYTLLYFSNVSLHELIQVKKDDLILTIQTGELNTFDPITNVGITHTLSENGTKILTKLAPEIELIFDFYGFQFLGNSKSFSDKTWSATNFMRFVNEDMKTTCIKYQLRKLNHNSFRIGDISELIKQKKPEQNIHKIEKEKEEKTKRMFDPS